MCIRDSSNATDETIYQGFDFDKIDKDIFGNNRVDNNAVGAIISSRGAPSNILDKKQYGANWYSNVKEETVPQTHVVTTEQEDLVSKIEKAKTGDIIELSGGNYTLNNSLVINKSITIQSKDKKATIKYIGEGKTPVFAMHPNGSLTLKNITCLLYTSPSPRDRG